MSTNHEFYLARAAEARDNADKSQLANVRDRCLRSEKAWMKMADRAERAEEMRSKADAEKAAVKAL
jgi:hypothetical protein